MKKIAVGPRNYRIHCKHCHRFVGEVSGVAYRTGPSYSLAHGLSVSHLFCEECGRERESTSSLSVNKVHPNSISRRAFMRGASAAAFLGAGALLGSGLIPTEAATPTTPWGFGPGSMVVPPSYEIFQDGTGTIFTRNGQSGAVDNSFSDWGAAVNYAHSQLPSGGGNFYLGQGGHIHTKKASSPYIYTTTPLISKSYTILSGEGRGTLIQPGASVNGITLQSPSGSGLIGPEIRDLSIYDPSANGIGKAYILIDPNTNIENITHAIIDNITYWGGPNQASSTGKLIQQIGVGSGPFGINGTVADFVISRIMAGSNFLQYPNATPLQPLYTSDTLFDWQSMYDCTFQNWFYAAHNVFGSSVHFVNGHNPNNISTGNEWYNIKLLSDATVNALTAVLFDNVGNQYFEDLFFEMGSQSGSILLEIANHAARELRFRRLRLQVLTPGFTCLQFDANAQHDQTWNDVVCWEPNIVATGAGSVGIKSVAGDASIKTFYGGFVSGNGGTLFSPDPLTGAMFFKTSRGGVLANTVNVPDWGWLVTTPSLPAGVGLANAVQNLTGVPVVVYQTGMSGTHVIDQNGTDAALGLDPNMVYLSALAKLYYGTTIPSSWKWFGA